MFLLFCPDLCIRSLIDCLENRGTLTITGVVVPQVMCPQLWFSSFELELEAVGLWLQTPILVQLWVEFARAFVLLVHLVALHKLHVIQLALAKGTAASSAQCERLQAWMCLVLSLIHSVGAWVFRFRCCLIVIIVLASLSFAEVGCDRFFNSILRADQSHFIIFNNILNKNNNTILFCTV